MSVDNAAYLLSGLCAVSDSHGAFSIKHVPAGRYVVAASHSSLSPLSVEDPQDGGVDVRIGVETSGVRVFLYRGHRVTGVVRDSTTGKPIPHAKVACTAPDSGKPGLVSVVSNSLGRYELRATPSYSNRTGICAAKSGYAPVTVELELPSDELEVERDIRLPRTVAVTGIVKSKAGLPLSGVRVVARQADAWDQKESVDSAEAKTDATGHFAIEVARNSKVEIAATVDGFAPGGTADPITVGDTAPSGIEIVLKQTSGVAGVVVTESGEAVDDAIVLGQLRMALH